LEAIFFRGSKSHIETIGSDLRIKVSTATNWLVVVFLSVWLFFWGIGEFAAVTILFGQLIPLPSVFRMPALDFGAGLGPIDIVGIFLFVWLIFWTLGGIQAARHLVRTVATTEVIEVNSAGISVGREIIGLVMPQQFGAEQISLLRPADPADLTYRTKSFGRGRGALAFDHGYDTVTFGEGLKPDEAQEILRVVKTRFPRYFEGGA